MKNDKKSRNDLDANIVNDRYQDPYKPDRCLLLPVAEMIPVTGLINTTELCSRVGVDKSTISRWIDRGLPAYRVGSNRYKFDYAMVCEWLRMRFGGQFWLDPKDVNSQSWRNACLKDATTSEKLPWISEIDPLAKKPSKKTKTKK